MRSRRVVEHTDRARRMGQRGPKLWAYSYDDLAQLLGTTAGALRVRTSRGTFDPADLEAIAREWALRKRLRLSPPDDAPALRPPDPRRPS